MPQLQMMITNAGLDAIVAAEASGTDQVTITDIGLTNTPFVMAPTITNLPGQFKLLDTVSGQEIAPNVIHMTAYDTSADSYDITGFGLYDSDGVLIAVYSHASDAVMTKASLAFGLIAIDIAFTNNIAAVINFGGALFLYPPASETVQGIARFATQAEVDAFADGPDAYRAVVTDKTLRARLNAFIAGVNLLLTAMANNITALAAKTVTGTGAATGGGPISANPVIDVPIAPAAAIIASSAASAAGQVVTTKELGLMPRQLGASGYMVHPGGVWEAWGSVNMGPPNTGSVTLPISFPNSVRHVVLCAAYNPDNSDSDDEYFWPNPASFSASGFTISSRGDGPAGTVAWRAIGD